MAFVVFAPKCGSRVAVGMVSSVKVCFGFSCIFLDLLSPVFRFSSQQFSICNFVGQVNFEQIEFSFGFPFLD